MIKNIKRYTCITLLVLTASFSYGSSVESKTILILGDSLSAGYGIQTKDSWPVLLQSKLDQKGFQYHIHNASISGQTSSEGANQIDQLLSLTKPNLVILELGANDGLRGLSTVEMQNNLQKIIRKSLATNAQVLLIGIKVPANYGRRYSAMFESVFKELATSNHILLIPFMLEPLLDVITVKNRSLYIQTDGLHPTALAQPIIVEPIYEKILSIIKIP